MSNSAFPSTNSPFPRISMVWVASFVSNKLNVIESEPSYTILLVVDVVLTPVSIIRSVAVTVMLLLFRIDRFWVNVSPAPNTISPEESTSWFSTKFAPACMVTSCCTDSFSIKLISLVKSIFPLNVDRFKCPSKALIVLSSTPSVSTTVMLPFALISKLSASSFALTTPLVAIKITSFESAIASMVIFPRLDSI